MNCKYIIPFIEVGLLRSIDREGDQSIHDEDNPLTHDANDQL